MVAKPTFAIYRQPDSSWVARPPDPTQSCRPVNGWDDVRLLAAEWDCQAGWPYADSMLFALKFGPAQTGLHRSATATEL
jgi:hypothetical protein